MKYVPAWYIATARDGDNVLLPREYNLRIVNYMTPVSVPSCFQPKGSS